MGKQKGLHCCYMVLEFRNPLSITSLENLSSCVLNKSGISGQAKLRNVEVSKSSSGVYRYLTHTTDGGAMMERKTRYEAQELFAVEYEHG